MALAQGPAGGSPQRIALVEGRRRAGSHWEEMAMVEDLNFRVEYFIKESTAKLPKLRAPSR